MNECIFGVKIVFI